jgi:hypothetical protein
MMTIDEAMKNVRGMIKAIKYDETRPLQRAWMHKSGFGWIIDDSETGLRDHIPTRQWTVDAARLPALIDAARRDPYALEAAETLARMHLRDRKPLPDPLAKFVLDWMGAPPKRKKKENPSIRARDEFIAMLVGYLKRNASVNPTRGRFDTHRVSGCDLVMVELSNCGQNLSYTAVEAAWGKHGDTSER